MSEHTTQTRKPGAKHWIRILSPPQIAVAFIAALAMIGIAACSDDAQQQSQQSEQPVRQVQQQEQQEQQVDEQETADDYQAEQMAATQEQADQSYEQSVAAQEQQQAEQQADYESAQQEEEAEQASQEEASSSSSSARRQQQSSDELRASPPAATNFEDYATTGWRETVDDDTSTFSLDVDRTSYFLALNWVENGYQIEPASVRAEEWINAFNYNYDLPDVDDSFAVTTDIVEHPTHDRLHLVRIATQAPEFVDNTPLNVTLVLDSSGSMGEGDRVEIARAAAESIRRGLSRDDRLAVVLFDDNIVYFVSHLRPDDTRVRDTIQYLAPLGGTNVQRGLNLGVRYADDVRRERPDAYNYVILMSDGVANVDATDPFAILETAEDRDSSNPLRLITVGVGIQNYNDVLLEQLAQYGNGWYRYLSDVAEARRTFSRENWLALSIPFADQTRAQVRWDDDSVLAWRLVGYENRVTSDRNFEQDRKEFAEIPMGSATTMFFEVELSDEAISEGIVDLGEVELRWLVPMSDESRSQQVQMVSGIAEFGDDAMLDLGSVVALSADRYSWFDQAGISADTMSIGAEELDELAYWFWELPSSILDSQAGEDFARILAAMGAIAEEHESEDPGYSR